MIEIKETLNANISQSVKDAISAVMPGVEQKITTLTETIESQTGEISNFQSRLDTFEDRLAALEKKEKEAKDNETNKALKEEVLHELKEGNLG